ncbi:Calcium-transporting ATPase 8, plasma membrane-type [Acorus calamus]|uniref:Calcium-transporting ATPase n=1 Tax=Acorus calamus TaxID=4465 RepID=A0AAV9CJP0_ACOCL|nr:Calcium-transporting ATPase 8, plasma membrane-type [Acorus calamus]
MSSDGRTSSNQYHQGRDVESGKDGCGSDEDEVGTVDLFEIPPKNAPIERLRRWRQAALVLNASRRFRYTLNLKKEEEKEKVRRKIRLMRKLYGLPFFLKRLGKKRVFQVQGLSNLVKTNLEKGINGDDGDILGRRNAFGANQYPRKKGRSFWRFLWEAWQDLTLIILMVAAAVSLVLGIKTEGIKEGWYDGGSIAFAVALVILVTAVSDYRQSLQFQNLNDEKRNIHIEVIRGGRRTEISIFDLVVGDIVPLKIGDQVHKDHKAPFFMSGCKVADGYGTMLVRLNGVATFIGIVGLSVAFLVLLVLIARYFTGHTKNPDGTVQFVKGKTGLKDAANGVVKIITIAVTIVVVAVPEGLPLAVTLTLAYSMRKMMADKALARILSPLNYDLTNVRRLSACETMGSATTICSDKTGTLTLNQMTVVEAFVGGERMHSPNSLEGVSSAASSYLIEGVAQNTTGSVFMPEDGKAVEVSGSPTEKAILSWGVELGMKFNDVRSRSTVLHVFPFNSEKKRGGVALQLEDSEVHIHWKGAAEIVLSSCKYWLATDGTVKSIDNKIDEFKKMIDDMAAKSLRCVAFAYRLYSIENIPNEEQRDQWALPEDELIFLAIAGLKDPCRPGVKNAVQLCTHAGVKVRMVTGDNVQTAKAIALECGILDSEASATEPTLIEGKSFRALSEKQREEIAEKISVMGRSSPNDKLLLVQALRKKGHVVAVTGDGTNDAPALHEADIGLAMGIQGTEVAKESSDIIILDDNFASVVKVVRWGRSVYANIQKFIQFQLTVNVAALVINVVAAISSGNVPLNAVQLLWVNLIMDTLGALALATEPPTDHLMDRPPVGRREPLVTNIMWRNLIVQAVYQVTVLLILNFGGRSILHLKHESQAHADKVKNSFIFNTFVLCQVFNEFNARKPDEFNVFRGVTKNRLFIGIIGLTILLQVLIIEFLGKFASTVKLNWQLWLVSIAIAIISWPLALLGKLLPVPETPYGDLIKKRRPRSRSKSRSQHSESSERHDAN